MKILRPLFVLCLLLSPVLSAQPALPVTGQVTFLYYDDIAAAAAFYRETLGLENTLDESPRVSRRLHFLRGWSHEQTYTIFTRGPRACCAAGL
jgi:hypothetical protein